MSVQKRTIDLDDTIDRRRYRCPRGHCDWEPTNHHYYCASCARSWEFDGEFERLHDQKTGELLERDEVTLETEAGSYVELFKGGK